MKVKDMNTIQLTEMTMQWDIEHAQAYLDSIHHGDIHYPPNYTELEMLRDHEEATQQLYESQHRYDEFMTANAEWFI